MGRTFNKTLRGGRSSVGRRVGSSRGVQTGVLQRSKFSQSIVQQQRANVAAQKLAQEDAVLANKVIVDINAGRIKNLSQIPLRVRSVITVTQPQLNQISSYYSAQADATLWKQAYDLADRVISSTDPRAIFAISFSDNKYARTAYSQLRSNVTAYNQRKKQIQDIRSGKTANVKIIGGRIFDLDTNKPITPFAATSKQFYTTLQKELPVGEKLLIDRNYNITGIKSAALRKVFPFNNKAIAEYNRQLPRTDFSKLVSRLGDSLKITNTSRARINIKFPNGNTTTISSKGRVIVGAALAGKKYVFEDGVLISVGGVSTNLMASKVTTTPEVTKVKNKLTNWAKAQILKLEQRRKSNLNALEIADRGRELQRLRVLQALGSNLTNIQKREVKILSKRVAKNYGRGAQVLTDTMIMALINTGIGGKELVVAMSKSPKAAWATIAALPAAIGTGLKKDFNTLMSGDPLEIALLWAEYEAVGRLLEAGGKLTGKVLLKVNPFLKKIKNGKIILKVAPSEIFKVKGTERFLRTRVQAPSFKRPFATVADFLKGRKPGQFKKFQKTRGLELQVQTVKSGAKTLSEQVKFSGKQVTAVNAAADQLTSWLKRKQIIRKPIPGEALFPSNIKRILKKFDKGIKLTQKEFGDVNRWLRKNVADNITLLERSLYLDPASGLRISRLGIQAERTATLRDLFTGNFKLRANKPQILIFENAMIEKLPKTLSKVKNKLLKNQKLTEAEVNQLIAWQVKRSGKFKPIGSTIYEGGIELEVTLAPGEIIKRVRKAGTVVIEGKKVSMVMAEVYRPTAAIRLKIKLAQLGKLAKSELAKLEKFLSKKANRKIKIETPEVKSRIRLSGRRRNSKYRPVVRISTFRIGFKTGIRSVTKREAVRRKVTRRKTKLTRKKRSKARPKRTRAKRKPAKRPKRSKARPKRKPAKRPKRKRPRPKPRGRARPKPRPPRPRPPKPRPPRGGGGSDRPKPRPRIGTERFGRKKLKKKQPVYFIKVRRKGKIVNLHPRPLILSDAKDFLAHKLDRNLVRSGWFEPLAPTREVIRLPKVMQGYFGRNKKKLRPYKIKVGKKKTIRRGYIEKRKYILDTRGEKKQLASARRRKATRRKPVRRKPVRRRKVRKPMKRKPIRRKRK